MNDSKRPAAVSLNALPRVPQRIDNVMKMLFKMDLQRISLPLKRIGNLSKCIGNALQRIYKAFKMHYNIKNASTLFSLSLLFPNRVTNDPEPSLPGVA